MNDLISKAKLLEELKLESIGLNKMSEFDRGLLYGMNRVARWAKTGKLDPEPILDFQPDQTLHANCIVCGQDINPEIAILNTGMPDCCDNCSIERREEYKLRKVESPNG